MGKQHHVLVLGATGASGLQFIDAVLNLQPKWKMTLLVRSRAKLPSSTASNPRIRIVEGSLSDRSTLATAMSEDVDTVVSFLGAYLSFSAFVFRTKTTPIADSFPGVLAVMREHGIRRILALSTPTGFPVAEDRPDWGWTLFKLFPLTFAPQGNAEMAKIARTVSAQTDFDWTIFRIPILTDAGSEKTVAAGFLGDNYKGTRELSRGSLARWVMKEIEERSWVRKAPAVGNVES